MKLAFDLRQRESELERARDVWMKKFGSAPTDAVKKARQMRFLQGRGVSSSVIRQALARVIDVDS